MTELTISRADLVEIATEALSRTEGLTERQHLDICETAHTMKSVLLGDWITPKCGCLVGTRYRSEFTEAEIVKDEIGCHAIESKLGTAIHALGLEFDELLLDHLRQEGCEDFSSPEVTVIG